MGLIAIILTALLIGTIACLQASNAEVKALKQALVDMEAGRHKDIAKRDEYKRLYKLWREG